MRFLITGSASGFGQALSAELRSRGEEVRGIDLVEEPGLIAADIRDVHQVNAAVSMAIEQMGGLDVLVNNAGIGVPAVAGEPPDEDSIATIETNLLGTWRVTAAALPALLESRGRVINIASGLALITLPFAAAYIASKRAVVGYSDCLRVEYGHRIGVTTVYPGYVKTPIHRRSEEVGMGLAGVVPEEPISAVVNTLTKAIYAKRPPRDLATSRQTAVGLFFARHFPGATERVVRSRVAGLVKKGRFPDLAATGFAQYLSPPE